MKNFLYSVTFFGLILCGCKNEEVDPIPVFPDFYIELVNNEGHSFLNERNSYYKADSIFTVVYEQGAQFDPLESHRQSKGYFKSEFDLNRHFIYFAYPPIIRTIIDYRNGDLDTLELRNEDHHPFESTRQGFQFSKNIYQMYFNNKHIRTIDFRNNPDSLQEFTTRNIYNWYDKERLVYTVIKEIDYDELDSAILAR
jgi:hypothetical protein